MGKKSHDGKGRADRPGNTVTERSHRPRRPAELVALREWVKASGAPLDRPEVVLPDRQSANGYRVPPQPLHWSPTPY
ncbi:hypothetical protein [Nocardia aobensis]|uniref:hypothetical protein n=1 Tax=Nocardia aobensis TaxID=257277 RepID=UPI000319488D|nr:hypothetical protein [Nocardia aobensis]